MRGNGFCAFFTKIHIFLAYNIDFIEKLLLNYKQKQNGLLIVNKKWLRYLKKGAGTRR